MANDYDIERVYKFIEENKHPHCLVCESFEQSFDFGLIKIIEGEVLIQSRLPKDADIGNIITNEKYNPDEYIMGLAIKYCPFCAENLEIGFNLKDILKRIKEENENIK